MDTRITARGKTLNITTHGLVLSDGQVLHALRHGGIIPREDNGLWSIGVGLKSTADLCYQERTSSGKISKRIDDYGRITIAGYTYQSHGYSNPATQFGHISWSFILRTN